MSALGGVGIPTPAPSSSLLGEVQGQRQERKMRLKIKRCQADPAADCLPETALIFQACNHSNPRSAREKTMRKAGVGDRPCPAVVPMPSLYWGSCSLTAWTLQPGAWQGCFRGEHLYQEPQMVQLGARAWRGPGQKANTYIIPSHHLAPPH